MLFWEVQNKIQFQMNLSQSKYNSIGILAKHCDLSKLLVAENEASNFDLSELFLGFWMEIETIANEVQAYITNPALPIPTNYAEKLFLLNGGIYTDCLGKQRPFEGVYKIMAYYSYARYVVLNGFNDTATGMVTKTNDFSIPKTLKELEAFADKYRTMGKISFERTMMYVYKNHETFNYYYFCNNSYNFYNRCNDGLNNNCCCHNHDSNNRGTKAKGYGFKSRNINK